MMQRLGFIHDMMDVKVLILYVAAKACYPMSIQEIYELCYQDECLSYFDVCTAVPEMVTSGHLKQVDAERYEITDKGRQDGEMTADSIAFTVKQLAENAVARFNRQVRRSSFVKTQIIPRPGGDFSECGGAGFCAHARAGASCAGRRMHPDGVSQCRR